MKISIDKIKMLISHSLLKEFLETGKKYNFSIDNFDKPKIDIGSGFPPVDPPKSGGGGENCDDFGPKYDKSYGIVLDSFNNAFPHARNHITFLKRIENSGIKLPYFEASKDVIDYVTDDVIHLLAYDICRMKIQPAQLNNLILSPLDLLYGGYLPGCELE